MPSTRQAPRLSRLTARRALPLSGEVQDRAGAFPKRVESPAAPRYLLFLLASLTVGLVLALAAVRPAFGDVWVVFALALIAAVAEQGSIHLTSAIEESISLLPTVCAAVLFGPLAAMAVAAVSMIGDLRTRVDVQMPLAKWATYTCTRSITGGVAGLATCAASGTTATQMTSIAVATAVGIISAQVLDAFFAALTFKVRGSGRMSDVITAITPVAFLAAPLYAPLVAVLVFAYHEVSAWTIVLFFFFVPALAAQRSFTMYQNERQLAKGLSDANRLLERVNLSFATALVATLDARDQYTAGHSTAVAIYAQDIARQMGLSSQEQKLRSSVWTSS